VAGDDVVDLWSLPPGAANLDDATCWNDDDALDRLAAVLPALGTDFDPPSKTGLDPASYFGSGTGSASAHEPQAGDADSQPARRRPAGQGLAGQGRRSARQERRSRKRRPGRRALRPVDILVVLLAVYVAAVAGTLALGSKAGSAHEPTGGQRVVIDGPLPCPMYRLPAARSATTTGGGCFFVG
jgi:hypothetical protein